MHFKVELPNWVIEESDKLPEHMPTLESQMEAVIRFSRINFQKDTGGPFAAGIFEKETGKRVVIGVNRVVPGGNGPLRVRRHLPQPLPPEGGALTDDLYDLYDIFPLHDLDLSGQIDVFPICII